MKTLRIILSGLVCLTALVFVGCDKDKDNNDDNGGSSDKNYVIYDDKTYDIVHIGGGFLTESDIPIFGEDGYYRFSLYIGSDDIHCFPRLSKSCDGKTIDLTQHKTDVVYSLEVNDNNNVMDIHQFNYPEIFNGILNRGQLQEGTIFNSGTMKISQSGNTITFKVDGILKDGKAFKINAKFESMSEF